MSAYRYLGSVSVSACISRRYQSSFYLVSRFFFNLSSALVVWTESSQDTSSNWLVIVLFPSRRSHRGVFPPLLSSGPEVHQRRRRAQPQQGGARDVPRPAAGISNIYYLNRLKTMWRNLCWTFICVNDSLSKWELVVLIHSNCSSCFCLRWREKMLHKMFILISAVTVLYRVCFFKIVYCMT